MSTITTHRPGDWIGALFPASPTDRQMEMCLNIWWRVCVMHIPPRDQRFECEREFGSGKLDAVLTHQPLLPDYRTKNGKGRHLLFVFPERHLSTQEEYVFVPRLITHPDIQSAKMTVIDLVTKSPLIVGNFIRDDVRIVSC